MIPDGAVSIGQFSSILASIVGRSNERFSYRGDRVVDGKLISEFELRVPEEESDYLYLFGDGRKQQAPIAYSGSLLVAPQSSTLVRLTIHAATLPREAGACELTQTLDYETVRMSDTPLLLPTQARFSVTLADGTEAENRMQYSACHEFRAESKIAFEAPGGSGETDRPAEREVVSPAVPSGLPFRLVFTDRIETLSAAAGDVVHAKLTTPLQDRSGILFPAGSNVTGRLVSVRRFFGDSKSKAQHPSLALAVRLECVDAAGISSPLHAILDNRNRRFARLGSSSGRTQDSDAAVFEFRDAGPDYVVESGMESSWVTVGR
jgi:hypothetical protein